MMKKIFKGMLLSCLAVLAMLAGTTPAHAAKPPVIESVEYEGNGIVDVDFYGKVQYGKVKVTVKDTSGKSYKATVLEKDDDDISFKVKKVKAGRKYTFKISKIRRRGTKGYKTVTGSFRIAADKKIVVEHVEYDYEDGEVSFEFQNKVGWTNPKVTITDGSGNCVRWIEEFDDDEIEVAVKNLTRGKTYQYTITGISPGGSGDVQTMKGSFRA